MKVVLQDLATLYFLAWNGDWIPDTDTALDFPDVTSALDFVLTRGLNEVRVVIRFSRTQEEISLPPMHVHK